MLSPQGNTKLSRACERKITCGELELEQLIIPLLNFLEVLLVLDLQLVEVDHVQHLA